MTRFNVRLEISNGTPEDYERLHEIMETNGFSRQIRGGSGEWFQLPDAEYVGLKEMTAVELRDDLSIKVKTVRNRCRILVTEAGDRAWTLKTL